MCTYIYIDRERERNRKRDKVGLDLLDLLADNDGIVLAYLILSVLLVVELAVVFVRVAMLPAVEAATTAVEAGEADLAFARVDTAPRALLLLARRWGRSRRAGAGGGRETRREHHGLVAH